MNFSLINTAKRLINWNRNLAIYENGENNDYPMLIDNLTANSITAKMSQNIMAQYIIGGGLGEADNYMINSTQKLFEFTEDLTNDLVQFCGYYIHFSYNGNFEPVEPVVLRFENCRIGKKDSEEYNGKILYKKNWKDSKEKPIVYDVYNPNKTVVEAQIKQAGSLAKYKGQVLFYNMDRKYYYPLARIDAVMDDCDSESQSKKYKNTLLRKGFFGKQVVVTAPLVSNTEPEYIYENGERVFNPEFQKLQDDQTQAKKTIEDFIGAENSGGALVVELSSFDDKIDDVFKVITIDSKIDDELFNYTESSVRENILMAFNNLPIDLVRANSTMFSNGEYLERLKETYYENLTKERNIIETQINAIVQNQEAWNGGYVKFLKFGEKTSI